MQVPSIDRHNRLEQRLAILERRDATNAANPGQTRPVVAIAPLGVPAASYSSDPWSIQPGIATGQILRYETGIPAGELDPQKRYVDHPTRGPITLHNFSSSVIPASSGTTLHPILAHPLGHGQYGILPASDSGGGSGDPGDPTSSECLCHAMKLLVKNLMQDDLLPSDVELEQDAIIGQTSRSAVLHAIANCCPSFCTNCADGVMPGVATVTIEGLSSSFPLVPIDEQDLIAQAIDWFNGAHVILMEGCFGGTGKAFKLPEPRISSVSPALIDGYQAIVRIGKTAGNRWQIDLEIAERQVGIGDAIAAVRLDEHQYDLFVGEGDCDLNNDQFADDRKLGTQAIFVDAETAIIRGSN